jgi:hypothetical protein
LIDAGIGPPGAFMEYRGAWAIATFVLAHIAFGALVGGLYGSARYVLSATTDGSTASVVASQRAV